MRREKKWVYFCDHCDKASRSGGAIARHERHCTKAPERICRMCLRVGNEQVSIQRMRIVIATAEGLSEGENPRSPMEEFNVNPLRDITHNCPACILSAIRQYEDGKRTFSGFNFKQEAKDWIEDYRAANVPTNENGDLDFDPDLWTEHRTKRGFANIGLLPKPHSMSCECPYCACPF